jgi:simple sugar transport system ATP-binding protein
VLEFVKELRDKGIAVIFITHNLYHVYSVADRIVVIAHGNELANMQTKDTTVDAISSIIVRGTLGEEL